MNMFDGRQGPNSKQMSNIHDNDTIFISINFSAMNQMHRFQGVSYNNLQPLKDCRKLHAYKK